MRRLVARLVRRTRLVERDTPLRIAGGIAARVRRAQIELDIGGNHLQRNENAAADGRSALKLESVDRRQQILAILCRRLHDGCRRSERDDADPRAPRLFGDEATRGGLRRGDAARLHIGGAHAARNVERENDGFVL